ncbi:DEAD/DEAH box helicase [Bizionia gelidisalsuginis]|uniref:DEAD/DEAH box helicase n=1 Tax=Bizionia gelidisalsuginis TaxID=291188 RepID=A0ABY3MC50_9FLAO|nr:DEAD/DEAH box helicase [Bizionia gelidisalsuginis]TYC14883.1 DEAD/DEAH box helicase [Bizionia gelidisalsuginis]
MSFKKLNPEIKEALITNEIETPTSFQKRLLPKIKSGIDIYGTGKKGAGKTTAMIIGTMQILGSRSFEDAPRALILVKDKQAAIDLKDAFLEFTRRTDLRIYTAYEEHDIDTEKEDIYIGQDIVIVTPKRLNKLFFLNAINVTQLKLFVIEDAEFVIKAKYYNDVIRVPESIEKCQFLILAEELYPKLKRLDDLFMANAITIKA